MPFGTEPGQKPVPNHVPADKAAEWAARWNSAFDRCRANDGYDCEASAFQIANAILDDNPSGTPTMVASFLSSAVANDLHTQMQTLLADTSAEIAPPEAMHITLVNGGMIEQIDADMQVVRDIVQSFASWFPLFPVKLNGIGRFFETQRDDGMTAVYVNVDAVDLSEQRQYLLQELRMAGYGKEQNHGFTPHVTLAYLPEDVSLPDFSLDVIETSLNAISLVIGNKRENFSRQASSTDTFFIGIHQFANIDPEAWVKILPIGTFERFGRKVKVTAEKIAEMARNFGKVPDTVVALNVEHEHGRGKIADVVAVKARDDGLFARFGNFVNDGEEKITSGAFQYFSPEIRWGPFDFDGKQVSNVLAAVALTNMPFFGNKTALYNLVSNGDKDASTQAFDALADEKAREILARVREESSIGGFDMTQDNDEKVSLSLVEAVGNTFASIFKRSGVDTPQPEPEHDDSGAPTPAPEQVDIEEYRALAEKVEKLETENAEHRAVEKHRARVEAYSALSAFNEGLPELLASHPDQEVTDKVAKGLVDGLEKLRATGAQEKYMKQILGTVGVDGHGEEGDPVEQFVAAIAEVRQGKPELSYQDAVKLAGEKHPDLYAEYRKNARVYKHSGGE